MKRILIIAGALVGLVLIVALMDATRGKAQSSDSDSRIQQGFDNAPVTLDLKGKNRALVGLGSYLVNVAGDCNGCHTRTASQFVLGGDPFKGEPKHINEAAYLAGGFPRFGPVFIPRNLTPDKTGRPEGGASFEEFLGIMRTGIDPDHAHLFIGNPFLQVMPWPAFQDMTDRDLRAIYEYLSAIPCIEGDPGLPNPRPIGTRCQ